MTQEWAQLLKLSRIAGRSARPMCAPSARISRGAFSETSVRTNTEEYRRRWNLELCRNCVTWGNTADEHRRLRGHIENK
jgi:hypothetical protein